MSGKSNGKLTRKRIFDIIQIGSNEDVPSRSFDIITMVMILANLVIAILDTFDISPSLSTVLGRIEFITVIWFTAEYALRLWTADFLYVKKRRGGSVGSAVRYALSFSGIIDVLSFLPYWLPVFLPSGMVAFRMFRVIRILRLFRVNAYYDALNVIADVIKGKKDQLLSSIFIIFVLMIASSLCMYSLEHEAQPEVFENAFSGFWWAVSSLLTVGYGDIYPITPVGRLFGICITFLGVGMVAIPTGIISAGFVEQYSRASNMSEAAGTAFAANAAGGEQIPDRLSEEMIAQFYHDHAGSDDLTIFREDGSYVTIKSERNRVEITDSASPGHVLRVNPDYFADMVSK